VWRTRNRGKYTEKHIVFELDLNDCDEVIFSRANKYRKKKWHTQLKLGVRREEKMLDERVHQSLSVRIKICSVLMFQFENIYGICIARVLMKNSRVLRGQTPTQKRDQRENTIQRDHWSQGYG
jgi:hypothetical protein